MMIRCPRCGNHIPPDAFDDASVLMDRDPMEILVDFLVNGCVALDPQLPRFSLN